VIDASDSLADFVVRMNINARLILLTTLCIRIQISAKSLTLTKTSQKLSQHIVFIRIKNKYNGAA
jgi:hypothetical protein